MYIDYFYLEGLNSFDQKLIFYVTSAKKPFSVNVAALSREFGVTEPTFF